MRIVSSPPLLEEAENAQRQRRCTSSEDLAALASRLIPGIAPFSPAAVGWDRGEDVQGGS